MNANLVDINLFGPPRFTQRETGEDLTPKRNYLALFCILAVNREGMARKALARMLWPHTYRKKALLSMRVLLHRMPPKLRPLIRIQKNEVGLRPTVANLDILQFDQYIEHARQSWESQQHLFDNSGRHAIEGALSLYKGKLMSGFCHQKSQPFNRWLGQQRTAYEQQVISVVQRLIQEYRTDSRYEDGIKLAEKLLEINPLHQANAQMLIQLRYEKRAFKRDKVVFSDRVPKFDEIAGQSSRPKLSATARTIIDGKIKRIASPLSIQQAVKPTNQKPRQRRTSVPQPIPPLVGREELLKKIRRQLSSPDCRLLSLVGMRGIGKTHLALVLAHTMHPQFRNGVLFVPLASENGQEGGPLQVGLRHATTFEQYNALARATLSAMGMTPDSGRDPFEMLVATCQEQEMLILYDNVESFIGAAFFFEELLAACPGLSTIVTTRMRLNLPMELSIAVHGLDFLTEPEGETERECLTFGAVRLFYDRGQRLSLKLSRNAERREKELQAILTICELTGGHPLALINAASWVKHYTLDEIASDIGHSYRFLKPMTNEHCSTFGERSIEEILESIYADLSYGEKKLLGTLALYQKPFSRQVVRSLSDQSLSTLLSLYDRGLFRPLEPGWYDLPPLVARMAEEKFNQVVPLSSLSH